MRYLILLLVLFIIFFGCVSENKEAVVQEGLEFSNMDTTARPQDDLFRFANGGWLDRTNIPDDKGAWGSFDELFEYNNAVLLEVLKEAGENPNYIEGTDQRKAADFYSIGMDSLLAEKAGMAVLNPTFEKIMKIKSGTTLTQYLVDQELEGGGAFFDFYVISDLRNAEKMAAYFGSGGIGLPERDYYLKTDDKLVETRDRYKKHVANMLQLSGESTTQASMQANQIMGIETRLARATLTKEESRDPSKQYHKKSIQDLARIVSAIDWQVYMEGLGVKEDSIILTEPAFMEECQRIFTSGNWDGVKAYLKWQAIRGAAPFLHHDVVKESFDFNSKYLNGIDQMRPRWKRVLSVTDHCLGDALGQLYVDKTFPPEAKAKALEMVENIRLAMADRIKNLDWMSDSTKAMALKKLITFSVKIGYPDQWKSYAG